MMPEVPSIQPDTGPSDDRNAPDGSGPSRTALPPASLGRSLRHAFRLIWDRLGIVLLVSLTGTVVLLLSLTLGLLVPLALPALLRTFFVGLVTVIALSPLVAVSFDMAIRIASHREITFHSFRHGVRQFSAVAIRLGVFHFVVSMVVALNVTFYLQLGGLLGRAAVVLCLYLLLFWSAMAVYQGPLLILQETGAFDEPGRSAKRGAKAVIRRSFFLVVGEPLYSVGLGLATLAWTILALLTAVGAAMLWLGGFCVLTTVSTMKLMAKYGVMDPAVYDELTPTKEA
jgi:hypothetical protein